MSYKDTDKILDKLLKVLKQSGNNPNTDLDLAISQQGLYDIADSRYSSFIQDHMYCADEDILEDFKLLELSEKLMIVKYLDCCIGFMNKCVDDNKPVFYERFQHILSLLENFRMDYS